MPDKRVTISEKDLYCIAKILQSSLFGQNQFDGCEFCQYQCHVINEKGWEVAPNYDKVIQRLQAMTGVDFSYMKDLPPKRIREDKSRCGDSDF